MHEIPAKGLSCCEISGDAERAVGFTCARGAVQQDLSLTPEDSVDPRGERIERRQRLSRGDMCLHGRWSGFARTSFSSKEPPLNVEEIYRALAYLADRGKQTLTFAHPPSVKQEPLDGALMRECQVPLIFIVTHHSP